MSQKPCATLLIAIYFRPKYNTEPEEYLWFAEDRGTTKTLFFRKLYKRARQYLDLTQGCPMVSSLVAYAIEGINIRRTKSWQRASRQRNSR
jgi:hypothetical protein